MDGNDFFKGALLGGLVGGIAGLLMAPKAGQELRDDVMDKCNSFTEKTHDLMDKGHRLIGKGRRFLHSENEDEVEEEEEEFGSSNSLLTGAIAGIILGSISAFLLAPESGKHLRGRLGDKYEEIYDKAQDFAKGVNTKGHDVMDQMEDWKDTLGTLVQKLSSKGKKRGSSKIDEIMDWADLGLSVLQHLQKKR